MNWQQKYKMSFSSGGLFINESVEVAKLHIEDEPWRATMERAFSNQIMTLPKVASNRRSLREIITRLETLSENDIEFLIYSDRDDQTALLWIAACRAYRFVREFAVEIIQERYLSGKLDLPLETFDSFFDYKAEWHEEIASISNSTRLKLRQILFRMLRESDIISKENLIQNALLSTRFIGHISQNNGAELHFLPGAYFAGVDGNK